MPFVHNAALHYTDLALLLSKEDWQLGRVVTWLMTVGRRIANPIRFTDALCRRLMEAGAPFASLTFSFGIIHPQVAACAFTWIRGRGCIETCLPHGQTGEAVSSSGSDSSSGLQQYAYGGRPGRQGLGQKAPGTDAAPDRFTFPLTLCSGDTVNLTVEASSPEAFSDTDVARFRVLATFLAPVVDNIAARRIASTLLDTYLGHRAGSKVLDGLYLRGDGESIAAAVWYSDLRDFTLLTESLDPDALIATLNVYFEHVAVAVRTHGGEVLRFVGDAMLAIFPEKTGGTVENTCNAAVDAAVDCFSGLAALNHQRDQAGAPPIHFGVGLHVGNVIYGNVGAPDRLDFTVMGPAVNRAARLEELTKVVGSPLLMSAELARHVDRPVRPVGAYRMRGVSEPQQVFILDGEEADVIRPPRS